MPQAGLLIALTNPKHPDLTEDTFNKWYSTQHIQDVVDAGLADIALRYKNLNPKAKWQYLAIYRIPDTSKLSDEKFMGSIRKDSDLLPGTEPGSKGGTWMDTVETDLPAYEPIQSFEGPNEQKTRAKGIVTVGMEPAEGTDDDFDDWYRKQVCSFPNDVPEVPGSLSVLAFRHDIYVPGISQINKVQEDGRIKASLSGYSRIRDYGLPE